MEKYSQDWARNFKKNLSEKFKFLFVSQIKNYEVSQIEVTDIQWDGNEIREMTVDLVLDYMGSCDGEHYQICQMLEKISTDVHNFFYQHQVHPITLRFVKEVENIVINDPYFLRVDFRLDELHKCLIFVRIDYVN